MASDPTPERVRAQPLDPGMLRQVARFNPDNYVGHVAEHLLAMTALARYAASCAGEERADIERRINDIVKGAT